MLQNVNYWQRHYINHKYINTSPNVDFSARVWKLLDVSVEKLSNAEKFEYARIFAGRYSNTAEAGISSHPRIVSKCYVQKCMYLKQWRGPSQPTATQQRSTRTKIAQRGSVQHNTPWSRPLTPALDEGSL